LGFAVCSVCRKYFGIEAEYLGYVNQDEDVRLSVTSRKPLVEFRPKSDASIYLERIARKLALSGGSAATGTATAAGSANTAQEKGAGDRPPAPSVTGSPTA
jgi:MinD-like ATPase involved in chromosome partitioning or flagellar assembly